MQMRIRAAVVRGGTSRAVVFHARDLPEDTDGQDAILLATIGSPDPSARHVDGLGGGQSVTSKIAIVAPSERPGIDVDYTFAQVAVDRRFVDRHGNCGNISSAIGPFAVDERLVELSPPNTTVRIFNTNTNRVIVAHVPTSATGFDPEGDFELPGVPGTGAPIVLDFIDPAGALTGSLLPTGARVQALDVDGVGEVEASIVDASNPFVFVRLIDVATTAELRAALGGAEDSSLLRRLEAVRAAGAVAAGLAQSAEQATFKSPAVPKLALVGPAAFHRELALDSASSRRAPDVAVVATTMGRLHRAYQLTGAICLTAAAAVPGTIAHEFSGDVTGDDGQIVLWIGHPSGVMEVAGSVAQDADGNWQVNRMSATRTARRIMEGSIFVPDHVTMGSR